MHVFFQMEVYEHLPAWNESYDVDEMSLIKASFSNTTDAFVTVFALSIFIANSVILTILTQILLKIRGRREAVDTIVNLFLYA